MIDPQSLQQVHLALFQQQEGTDDAFLPLGSLALALPTPSYGPCACFADLCRGAWYTTLFIKKIARLVTPQVTGHVEKAEALLGIRVVDEPAAVMAVSHARGEIAIARLAIRKGREAVDRAEEEERYVGVRWSVYFIA